MTLRQTLEQDAPRIHEQVDAMLENEDSIIILVDARRAINYARGFGLSACQLEMLANDIERLVRTVTRVHISRKERIDVNKRMAWMVALASRLRA